MTARSYPSRISAKRAKQALTQLLYGCTPERLASFTAAGLARRCILCSAQEGQTVLDPFGGAGTTGLVADRLQRSAILIELNPEYAAIAERRIHGDAPMFAEVRAA